MTLFNPPQTQQQQFPTSNEGTVTEFSLTTSNSLILSDRRDAKNRRTFMIFNDGTANALFSYGTTISPTAFTGELLPGGWFEDSSVAPWQGPVVMRSKNSPTSVNVTEITLI